jgi:transposase
MARPYSLDLRERAVRRVAAGESCRKVASLFEISVASVVKWSQRKRQTGSAAAKPIGGSRRRTLVAEREWLLKRIAEKPDLTLRAIVAELTERGVVASYGTVWNFFAAENISFKKNPARRRAGPARRGAKARTVEEVPGSA